MRQVGDLSAAPLRPLAGEGGRAKRGRMRARRKARLSCEPVARGALTPAPLPNGRGEVADFPEGEEAAGAIPVEIIAHASLRARIAA